MKNSADGAMFPSCFITGTDTDAGKTEVTAAMLRYCTQAGIDAVGLKPIASGFELKDGHLKNADIEALMQASNRKLSQEQTNLYRFTPAIAPHIAAEDAQQSISIKLITAHVNGIRCDVNTVLVEGVGGWCVPLAAPVGDSPDSAEASIESLAVELQLPVIIVVGMRLGCLNHALLTARAVQASGCELIGWVANDIDAAFARRSENLATLKALMPVPLLFEMPFIESEAELRQFTPEKIAFAGR